MIVVKVKYGIQENVNFNFLKVNNKQRLQDQFIQRWFTDMNNSSRWDTLILNTSFDRNLIF